MAWLEKRANRYRFSGQKRQVSLRTEDVKEAEACLHRFEENLRLVERGRLEVPPGADLGVFLLSDGKLNHRPVIDKPMTLKEFFDHYLNNHPEGAKETSTRYTEDIHIEHLTRLLGPTLPVRSITSDLLQARRRPRRGNQQVPPLDQPHHDPEGNWEAGQHLEQMGRPAKTRGRPSSHQGPDLSQG